MPILDCQRLCKTYKGRKVVDGVCFTVERGEIVGLLGPNGAGKTTSFRMTCGMIEPDAGKVVLNDIDVTDWPMYRRAREGGMGYLAQDRSDFRKLTVEQNILGMLELLGYAPAERKARTEELLGQFDIKHIRNSLAEKVSGGERRRMEIARCLVSNPEIILLDEPFAGVDPVTVQSVQGIIRRLRDRGIAILITDHAAMDILRLADRCYVIDKGTVLTSGPPAEVKEHPEVRRRYLGDIDAGVPGPPAPHIASQPVAREQLPTGQKRKPFANW